MTIQTAISKAIEGGWEARSNIYFKGIFGGFPTFRINLKALEVSEEIQVPLQTIALDPSFWKALGKVEGWKEYCNVCARAYNSDCFLNHGGHSQGSPVIRTMHNMTDALIDGKTIEQFIETL